MPFLHRLAIAKPFISNGEFEMTTNDPSNVYISNGQLYIMPTLTSDSISGGHDAVMNGATYQLQGCTAQGGGTLFPPSHLRAHSV
jgi:hypothetical protein